MKMPTLSVTPSTVEPKGAIKISWRGFRDGYWIWIRFLSGPPEFPPPGKEYPFDVYRVGNTADGSVNTRAPWKDGTYTWQAWQEVTGLKSNIVTVTVVAPPPGKWWERLKWYHWLILASLAVAGAATAYYLRKS